MDGWREVAGVLALGSIACGQPTTFTEEDRTSVRSQAAMAAAHYGFVAARTAAARGEDGAGRMVAATDPVALDVTAERFGARALDPVLHVGSLRFVHYTFPSKGVMRFVAADAGLLAAGSEVWLQWGDDVRTKVVLTRSLEVPK